MKKTLLAIAALAGSLGMSAQYSHTVQAEKLDRGVLAVKAGNGVFVSWRSFASDDKKLEFDVYREGTKVNAEPIKKGTNFTDPSGKAGDRYVVKAILGSDVVETTNEVAAWETFYKKIHLNRPEGGTVPPGAGKDKNGNSYEMRDYTYTPDDVSVGDVDGDGEWEYIVKWFPTNAADNSHERFTGNTLIDCYKLDGTQLWRIDLGVNIRSGNHYTQFMVYDFDGDGKAELMCKTAPGTVDGKGKYVLMGSDDPTKDYRNSVGTPLSGPEYLTVFNGETGAEIHTIAYKPSRSILAMSGSKNTEGKWGDNYGGRSERYLACVAYLDGQKPSAVFCRGMYHQAYLWAVDFDGSTLKEHWFHASDKKMKDLWGEGAHSVTVGDVDGDGCDEIVYGAACLDHDGVKVLYRTGAGHGDALHLTDMLPDRQGLEVFMPHEEKDASYKWDTELRDAETGEILYGESQSGNDIGRGLAANVTAKYPGYETWSSTGKVFNRDVLIDGKRPSVNFRIYWDGDYLDELLDGTQITKPNDGMSKISTLVNFSSYSNAGSCNGTKATPNLQADLFGDWREEVILHDTQTQSDLIIFTTTTPTDYRVPTLMQDRQYRLAVAWQNVAYNQPPHLSYNLEEYFNRAGAISVTSGNLNQVVDLGMAMTPVEFSVIRATGVVQVGLPEGVTMDFDPSTLNGRIHGTPVEEGEFSFTLTTTGANDDDNGYSEGVIKVRRNTNLNLIGQFGFEKSGETTPNSIYGEALIHGDDAKTVEGKSGNALSLGGNSYLTQEAYEALDFGMRDFTIEMWIKSEDTAAYIFQKGTLKGESEGGPAGATGNWTGLELKDGELRFAVDDGVKKYEVKWSEGSSIFKGEWHHIVLVRDTYARKLLMYVDGELKNSSEDNGGAINCPEEMLIIGNSSDFNNSFAGTIDEFSIYQGAMTAAKVKERFESAGVDLAYFPMDELGSTTPNKVFGEASVNGGGIRLVEGLRAGAMSFDNNGYLSQPMYDAINMGERDFTIEMWVKSTDDDGYLFCIGSHNKANVDGGTGNWIGLERKAGYLCFSIDDDKTKKDCKLEDASAVFDGNWHHIAAVRDFAGKTLRLYVDGKEAQSLDGVTTGALVQSETEFMYIGGDDETNVAAGQDVNRTFAGVIDELVVTPKALSAEEIEARYDLLKLSGIEDVVFNNDNALYTVVDAMSGIIVRSAVGIDREDIIDGLDKGIYILVVEDGKSSKTYKFVR